MICRFCKAEIPDGARTCRYCGQWLQGWRRPWTVFLLIAFMVVAAWGYWALHALGW